MISAFMVEQLALEGALRSSEIKGVVAAQNKLESYSEGQAVNVS